MAKLFQSGPDTRGFADQGQVLFEAGALEGLVEDINLLISLARNDQLLLTLNLDEARSLQAYLTKAIQSRT